MTELRCADQDDLWATIAAALADAPTPAGGRPDRTVRILLPEAEFTVALPTCTTASAPGVALTISAVFREPVSCGRTWWRRWVVTHPGGPDLLEGLVREVRTSRAHFARLLEEAAGAHAA